MSAAARAQAKSAQINPNWPHYASAALTVAVLIGSFLRWGLLDWTDPNRCQSYLITGQWNDPGKFTNWQPDGCIHMAPNNKLLQQCFTPSPETNSPFSAHTASESARTIRFVGDSTVRSLFFASSKLANPKLPASAEEAGGEKHSDRSVEVEVGGGPGHELNFEFWWDPFLNSTRTINYLSRSSDDPTGLLVMGTGLWYLRHPSSGGISAWTKAIDQTFEHLIDSQPVSSFAEPPPYVDPLGAKGAMLSSRGIAQAIMFVPVPTANEAMLNPERAQVINHIDIDAMNSDLVARLSHAVSPVRPPVVVPSVFNELLVPELTTDGIHYADHLIKKQAEIMFGWRCNDVASTYNGACCRKYKPVRPVQALVLLFICGWAPLSILLRSKAPFSLALATFGVAIAYMFIADRTTVFLKEQKAYNPWTFAILMFGWLMIGCLTTVKRDKDMGFLNREQTDEWKGWMQIAILVYHILGASKIHGIYNVMRTLVASYLFMTGYGHFTYYYKRKDFGIQRIAMVMVRLNLLSVVLPYTMNTDYVFYYFAPLVTFWYFIIYFTMFIGHQYNDKPVFMLSKICISAGLNSLLLSYGILNEKLFAVLHDVFGIVWSAREWNFRVTLDIYIVYGGMLAAYAYIKVSEYRLTDKSWWSSAQKAAIIASIASFVWYFWFELSLESKFVYNKYHYIACFPLIIGFTILRNSSSLLRSCSSRLFMFIGQCSLETFILQFHAWMASDTHGVLLVIPGTSWRPLNLVLSTIVYIWLSYKVSTATGEITEWAVGRPKKPKQSLPPPATAPVANGSDPASSVATLVAETIEPTKSEGNVPESIPLMNRDDGSGDFEKANDNDGLDLMRNGGGRSRTPSKFSEYWNWLMTKANENPAFKLGLVLVVLWALNLLY
ncbi:hypothetical protein QFC20_003666 [Naganishia adeliensis]|uniref:Uncharacterized protein n=1 Tax=Naganishia adeliensis TaxID=92952 RepID=A0ACC2WAW1_9TREE|nr:hypothetical protein QFC20_003666 [Naganishia adeliensis]